MKECYTPYIGSLTVCTYTMTTQHTSIIFHMIPRLFKVVLWHNYILS